MLTSVPSLAAPPLVSSSSRSRLGVSDIFLVSMESSLKNESVFRTVPFLVLLTFSSEAAADINKSVFRGHREEE